MKGTMMMLGYDDINYDDDYNGDDDDDDSDDTEDDTLGWLGRGQS
jgi:hypothetical protein